MVTTTIKVIGITTIAKIIMAPETIRPTRTTGITRLLRLLGLLRLL